MIKITHLLSLLILNCALSFAVLSQTTRVLIVGDSWAEQQWQDDVHAKVFTDNGYANFLADGSATVRSGSQASDWVMPDQLDIIAAALSVQPTIDTVQLTIGGNDFLGSWTDDMSKEDELLLQQQISQDTSSIVDFILAQDPNIEVVLSFYDYPNFEDTIDGFFGFFCRDLFEDLGSPQTIDLNNAAREFELMYAQIALNNPRVSHVSHFGLMQSYFLDPPILPPGDVSQPSPLEAMRVTLGIDDCFHLNATGYQYLIQNLYDGYFQYRFDQLHKSGFD